MTDEQLRTEGEAAVRRHILDANLAKVEGFCVSTLTAMSDHIEIASQLGCSAELTGIRKALSAYMQAAKRIAKNNQGE